MHTIAIANRKGGVGKSSVATNLAAAFCIRGSRVLLIDMDSQASATAVLAEDLEEGALTTTDVLLGKASLTDVIRPSTREGLFIAPAARDLTQAQLAMVSRAGRETILRRALRKVSDFDLVLIDTAPEQQLATVNSLVAASHVLMPFTPDPKALEGLQITTELVDEIVESELANVAVLGSVQVAYDRRLAVTAQSREQVQAAYGDGLLDTFIRANSSFIVCPAWHRDIFAIERADGNSKRRGSEDFGALADEVAKRLGHVVAPDMTAARTVAA